MYVKATTRPPELWEPTRRILSKTLGSYKRTFQLHEMECNENTPTAWCEDCQDSHNTDCPLAGTILNILGEPILSKAEASLPRSLNLKVINGEKHVIAGMAIPKGTQFGPYEGDLVVDVDHKIKGGFCLKIFKKNQEPMYLDTNNEDKCNWMCLVRAANNAQEQNLSAFQYKDGILFSATKDIDVDERLLVWYAPHYGSRLGKEELKSRTNSGDEKLLKRKRDNNSENIERKSSTEETITPEKIIKEGATSPTKTSSVGRGHKSQTIGKVTPLATRRSHRQTGRKFNVKELFNIKDDQNLKINNNEEPMLIEEQPDLINNIPVKVNDGDIHSADEKDLCSVQGCSSHCENNVKNAEECSDEKVEDSTSIARGEIGGKGIDWVCMECKMVFKDQFGLIDHVQSEVHTNLHLEVKASEPEEKQTQPSPQGIRKSTRIITPSPKKAAAEAMTNVQEEDEASEIAASTGIKKRGRGRPRKNEKHSCEMCEKHFDSRTQLVQHYLKHHQDDLDKLENVDIYSCLECGEGFWKKTDYESHMLRSHQGIPCKACDLTLTSMKAYNKHVLMHSEDLIPCGICSKRFLKAVLQAHLLEEHGRKDLGCSMCSHKFPSTSLLTSHLILDHNIKLATQEESLDDCEQKKSENFTCDLCSAVCEEPGLYITHMHEVHHLLMFRCDFCEKVFGTQSSLKKHLEVIHSMKSEYFCEYCAKVFIHEPSLKRHVEEVHEQKTLPCDICLKIFPSQRRLHEHMRTVHKIIVSKQSSVIEDLFKCKICNQEMASKGNLRRHMAVHSGQGTESEFKLRNDLKCKLCGVQFNRRYLYMEHLAYHKAKGEKVEDLDNSVDPDDVTCSLCGRVCTTKQNLHRHMAMHEEKPYACDYCDKKFLHEMSQKEHILSEHPEVDIGIDMSKTYKCETCPNVFLRRNVYNKHMRKHSNLVYKCSHCDSVFKRKDSVHRHNCRIDLDMQHVLTCEDCGAAFKFKDNMDSHECKEEDIIKYKEAKDKMMLEIDKFQCQVCMEKFDDPWSLKRHKKKHLPKLHVCDMCGRKFQFKTALKTHMKIHYKVVHDTEGNTQVVKIPYLKDSIQNICPECHCQFSTQKSFINHLKLFHSIEALPCTICPKVLTSEEEIIIHTEEHQEMIVTDKEIKKQMVSCACDQCNRVFLEPARLAKHKRMAHEKQQEFMCDTCGKMFNRKDSLKAHIRTHTQETVANCKECNKKFKSRIAYDMHLKIHRNQRDFKCTLCDKTFIQKGNLNKHLLTHNQTFNFECEVCKRKFNNPALLKRHALIHDELSKLVCDLCGHKFTRQYFLNKHIKQHHEFQNSCHCEQCGTFLKTVASYRRHMRRKHPDVAAPDFNPVMYSDTSMNSKESKVGNRDGDENDEESDISKEGEIIKIEHAKFDAESGTVIQELSVPASSLSSVLGSVIQGNPEQGFTVHIIQSPEVVVTSGQDGEVQTLENVVTGETGTETILQLDDGTAANLTPDVVEGVRVLQQFVELSGRVSEAEVTQATTQVTYENVE
ncbi:zinc finger protein 729-like isoform X2 [Anneissia japonica]|uniref:zinc finger protein 729-like isoform X2 n=1 Tax=Anneissia japonica TaxID=1529436 RepID=UPI001425539E|nr:zinc finger protein 729-like isoform X2 [Anneissia japonica]